MAVRFDGKALFAAIDFCFILKFCTPVTVAEAIVGELEGLAKRIELLLYDIFITK